MGKAGILLMIVFNHVQVRMMEMKK